MIQFYTWGAPVEKWGASDMTRIILFLVIFRAHFEECLRMLADRADLRSLGSYYDMSAVTALPDGNAALLKHQIGRASCRERV